MKTKKPIKRAWPSAAQRLSSQPDAIPEPGGKNRIHSVLTALPILMLVVGLWVYFQDERAQSGGDPVLAESVTLSGTLTRVTSIGLGEGANGKHYLWIDDGRRERGIRLEPQQVATWKGMPKGTRIDIVAAPHVAGSNTLWLLPESTD